MLHKLCGYNLYKADSKCKRCLDAKNPCIPGEGDINSEVMIIGMAPAVTEDTQNRIFIGRAGEVLNRILAELKINRKSVYITNAVKCFVKAGDKPKLSEIKTCSAILKEEILKSKAKKIIALGEVAFFGLQYAFLGKKTTKFSRGEIYKYYLEDREFEILSTYHPAYVLRNPHAFKIVVSDISKFFKEQVKIKYTILDTYEAIDDALKKVELANQPVVIDLETDTLKKKNNKIICVGIATSSYEAFIIPISYADPVTKRLVSFFNIEEHKKVIQRLKQFIEFIPIIGHNIKFDRHVLFYNYGIDITENIYFDTMVAHHLLREVRPHDLKTLAIIYSKFGNYFDEVKNAMTSKEVENWWSAIDNEKIWKYCSYDCCSNYDLYEIFKKHLKEENLEQLFNIAMKHYKVIMSQMEHWGLPFSKSYVEDLVKDLDLEIEKTKYELEELAGRNINWNSSKQVIELFLSHGIPLQSKTKKGNYSVNQEVLKKLADDHLLPRKLLEMRRLVKMKTTYTNIIDKYADEVDKKSNKDIIRIACNVDIVGTETGRLATNSPSLHTIPRENRYRNMVQAEDGYVILSGDYSMAELKVMAAYSKCNRMLEAFKAGFDLHTFTASNIFKIPIEKVTSEQRTAAKAVNFGIIYLISPFGLAKRLKIDIKEAEAYINKWFELYPEVKNLIDSIRRLYEKAEVGSEVCIRNIFGRKRRVIRVDKFIYDEQKKEKRFNPDYEHAIRELVNFLPQSTVADTLSIATIRFNNRTKQYQDRVKILLSIHDAILSEVKEDIVEEVARILRESMEFKLPFKTVDLTLSADITWSKMWEKI